MKDTHAQLEHARVSTTLDLYQQSVLESQRQAIDRFAELH